MSTEETLYRRALRILTDGRWHAQSALRWARRFTAERQWRDVAELQGAGFTLQEISLGMGEVVR
jgi:hypothetical protein